MALRNILSVFDYKINGAPLAKAVKKIDQYIVKAKKGAQATEKYNRTIRKGARSTKRLAEQTGGLSRAFSRLASDFKVLGAAYLGFQGVRGIITLSDEYVRMQNRLKVVTNGVDEFKVAQSEMFRVARDTRQPVKNVTEMFQRYSIATKSLGTSQADVVKLSSALIKGTLLSGTSAESAKGSIIQLAQGLGTNFEAAGQEIRSIQENAPLLAAIIAKAAGGTSDQLMKLAKEGKITSKLVVGAILSASDELDTKFAQQQFLLSEGATRLRTVSMKSVGIFNAWSKASSTLATGLVGIANAFERIIDSNITENFINIATMFAGAGAFKLMSFAVAGFVNQLGHLRAWLPVVARMMGGWIPLLRSVAVAIGRFLLHFILIPLAVEDFIAFLRGNRSLIGDLLAESFGKDTTKEIADTIRGSLQSIVDMFRILWSWLTGDAISGKDQEEMAKRSAALMKSFDKLGTWLEKKAVIIGKNIRRGLFGDFGETIEGFFAAGEAADSQTNSEINEFLNNIFGTNFNTTRKVRRSGENQSNPEGSVSPFARGTEADFDFRPVPMINSGGEGRTTTINDNRTTTINATNGTAAAPAIAAAVSTELTRDRRAIAAVTGAQ